jgi:hypothetical protein
MKYSTIGAAVSLAMLLTPALAAANTYDLDFSADGETGALVLTTSGPLSVTGTLVTSISGEVDGFAATELAAGSFASNDNLIYAGTPLVDFLGLGFEFDGQMQSLYWTGGYQAGSKGGPATAQTLNYDGDPFTYYKNFKRKTGPVGVLGNTGELALCVVSTCGRTGSPPADIRLGVPEPTTWVMMLVGFCGLGAAMRTRRRRAITA